MVFLKKNSYEADWRIMCYILLIMAMIDVNWKICVMGLAHCTLFLLNCGCAKLVVESVMYLQVYSIAVGEAMHGWRVARGRDTDMTRRW